MRERIFTEIERPEPGLVERLRRLGVATVYEAMGITLGRNQLMEPAIRPITPGGTSVGPALTARCHSGDNTMSHVVGVLAEAGDVLVIAGDPHTALWGDLTSTVARLRQVAGVVLDGGVRDVRVIRDMGLPVWAREITASKPVKGSPGSVNVPVRCAGVLVEPGDLVVADDDGVVVVPRRLAAAVLERAEAREAHEVSLRGALLGGNPRAVFDALGIQALLEQAGVETIEGSYADWRAQADGSRE